MVTALAHARPGSGASSPSSNRIMKNRRAAQPRRERKRHRQPVGHSDHQIAHACAPGEVMFIVRRLGHRGCGGTHPDPILTACPTGAYSTSPYSASRSSRTGPGTRHNAFPARYASYDETMAPAPRRPAGTRLARVAGIDIEFHPSWIIILLLIGWSLG